MDPMMSTTDADLPAMPEPVAWMHSTRGMIDHALKRKHAATGLFVGFNIGLYTADQLRAALASRDAELAKLRQGEPVASDVLRPALQQASLALEELDGPGYLIGGVMHYRIGLLLPKLNEALASLASPPPAQPTRAELSPLGEGPRRELLVTVEVPVDWASRLDMQWVLEREIRADRWKWDWPAQPSREPVQPLSDEDIKEAIIIGVRSGQVSWLGYEKDAEGQYTLPSLSRQHYQIARAAIAEFCKINGITERMSAPITKEQGS